MSQDNNYLSSLMSDDEDDIRFPYEKPFYYGGRYLHDYKWYHEKFPEEWALNSKIGTGPNQCDNCACSGCINGIFIGYCLNCAFYEYDGTRGRGFRIGGLEDDTIDVLGFPSAFDTYLKGVDITTIQSIENEIQSNYNPNSNSQSQSDEEKHCDENNDEQEYLTLEKERYENEEKEYFTFERYDDDEEEQNYFTYKHTHRRRRT
jgi:hypothetical protein